MNTEYKTWFDKMEEVGLHLTPEQRKKVENKLNDIQNYCPQVGFFGKTGVGKSSLCNALFGQDVCEISDVEACTRETKNVLLQMGKGGITLVDVPGVGESEERDEEYADLYANLLPDLDLVLWLVKADDRAMASDEKFYKNIVKPHIDQDKPFFFVVNQVDKIEPFREWNEAEHEPGPNQFQNIHKKVDAVADQFGVASSKVIPVSASEKYGLTKLVDEIVFALPKEHKKTVLDKVKKENQSENATNVAKRAWWETALDTIVEVAGKAVEKAVDKVVDKIGDWLDRWWPFW